jgi:hypothetical protein
MQQKGIEAVEAKGVFYMDDENEPVTSLIDGAACSFVYFDEKGITKCAIEKAHSTGAVSFKKPISCHLYPIRLTKLADYVGLNYHRWPICAPACECGSKLQVPVYRFLKDAITTKFGEAYFQELDEHYRAWKAQREA